MTDLLDKASKIKIIFFDIDDTLRVKTTSFMPESIKRVFSALKAKDILTGIATGRNLYGVVPEIRALNPDFLVTINGAYVEDGKHQPIYQQSFSDELVEGIVDWMKAEKSDYAYVAADDLRVSAWNDLIDEAIQPIYGTLKVEPDYYQSEKVYQMLTFSDHDDKIKLPESLVKEVRLVRWHEHSSDIVPVEGSKAIGCQKVLDQLGLKPEEAMNFGDGLNDRELFDWAGLSVAMEVSHPEILEKADYITDKVENDGILKALQELKIID
ncbi:Cof-type HAD-IIB family hydrolase [Lactococcus termiticola]|uniref:Haloacid dehalogenase n=1 Tax=Lactococcus termiticola TaxID=2169526 RepID=A0A2R5HF06_9LACT|nr:Cof-type HAD-IIB family hydrolase [Lactococcus termiticola]GBG96612.1 haloacid dehalogenase [Lactococcus termiticola]